MSQKKYKYNICQFFSEKYFKLQCKALIMHIPDLLLADISQDVDGSEMAIYINSKGTIRVINDYPVDALYVESDYDLMPYFS